MSKIFFIMTLFVVSARAEVCQDSERGINPEVFGKVVYSLGGQNCLDSSCITQMFKESDRCLNSKQLLEFSCRKGVVVERKIKCSPGHLCRDGACQNSSK
jgi:hypothetical protein